MSQVSVVRFAMVLDGTPTDVGCLHAVCTHPAYRAAAAVPVLSGGGAQRSA
ncbi:hypothetical protein WMF37_10035 [Sorangium sp. So ce291]|uniref:hypothetical protein n=1 Tax=Sorangium sp. So ce291 TaxID=3133294 RepID=UPI003F5EDE4E